MSSWSVSVVVGSARAARTAWAGRLVALRERIKRLTRHGNYWYWLEVPELQNGISIAELVCPLRYDVIVRRDFCTFYAEHRALCQGDLDAFLDRVCQTPYYTWYATSEAVRCFPHLIGDDVSLRARFSERVRAVVRLYENMMKNGFDRQFPIILRTGEKLLPPTTRRSGPPTGKAVSARYFQADGCHRLAMLMHMGYEWLPAEYFRVQCFRWFSPFDSTSLLARTLPLDAHSYFAYLSSYYCTPDVITDRETFLAYISQNRPAFLSEVLSVLRTDGFGVPEGWRQ
jgi:hypothetical protein